ncbi:MAG: heavy metal translocating P-type ATPase [Micrococcales bacterium]
MQRLSKSSIALLALTSLSLVVGLFAQSNWAFMFGSAIGAGLSIRMVWVSIREHEVGSDVLALISIIASAVLTEWLAGSIIALMLATGQALESWAAGRARRQLEALVQRAPRTVQLVDSEGRITENPIANVQIGDTFLVRTGEVVPVDGRLLATGLFDESALTGEPLPKSHGVGDEVPSGVSNAGSPVEMVAVTTAEDSTYSALVRLVENAKAHSAPGVRIANRYALWFVPLSLGLALATWLVTRDVHAAVSVIVAATPCPLILAVPIAIIAGISQTAKQGAIIKDGSALEQLARSRVLLVDKTGTLTHGGPEVTNIQVAPGWKPEQVLAIAAGLELASAHVLAKAVVRASESRELLPAKANNVHEVLGEGLVGVIDGHTIRVGRLLEPVPSWVTVSESLQICVDRDGEVIGVIDLEDPIREETVDTIKDLRRLGIDRILLVTGDRKPAADSVGAIVGVDEVFAECRPEDKLELVGIEKAAAKGAVLVVGDGINDSPALAAADVGVAMGARGATAASETASVVIVEDSIARLADAIRTAKGARNRALQAAGIGMGLSVVAMLSGAFGLVSITENAIAQEFIDAAAILWALVPVRKRS